MRVPCGSNCTLAHIVIPVKSGKRPRIFQNDRGAVAEWLGVPIGLVAAEPEAESDSRQMTGV